MVDGVGALPLRSYGFSGPSSQGISNSSSTFTGWSTTIGVPTIAFSGVDIPICPWDPGAVPSVVEVMVRDTTNTGTVLATGYASLAGLKMNQINMARINLNATVNTSNVVVIQWWTDGRTGEQLLDNIGLYPSASYPNTQYCTNTNGNITTAPSWTNDGSQSCKYVRYWAGPSISQFDGGTIANNYTATTTITGYGGPIGTITTAFNRAEFDIKTGTTAGAPLPTRFRCRFRIGSQTGTILADKVIQNLAFLPGQSRRIKFDLPVQVSGSNLWCEVISDGRFFLRMLANSTFPIASGYSQAQYQTGASIDSSTWSADSTQHSPYFRASMIDWSNFQVNGPDDFQLAVQQTAASMNTPISLMTRNLYGVTGREMFVSLDGTLGYPQSHESLGLQPYTFTYSSTKGTLFDDRWIYTPVDVDAGTASLTLNQFYGGVKQNVMLPTLNFCALANGSGAHKVLTIGDSTSGSSGAAWLAELTRLSATGTGATFTLVGANLGTNCTSPAVTTGLDSTNTSQSIYCEAWPGQSLNFYVTGSPTNGSYNSGHGPFFISGAFSVSSYLTNNSISMATNDWALIDMGTNDVFNSSSDQVAWTNIATYLSNLNSFITGLQSAVSGVRIGLMLPPPWAGQTGFGQTYGNYSISSVRARRNRDLLIAAVLSLYDNSIQNTNKIWVIPTHLAADPVNDFPTTQIVQGQYNNTLRTIQNNSVHMANWGYWRKASTVYAFLKNQG